MSPETVALIRELAARVDESYVAFSAVEDARDEAERDRLRGAAYETKLRRTTAIIALRKHYEARGYAGIAEGLAADAPGLAATP